MAAIIALAAGGVAAGHTAVGTAVPPAVSPSPSVCLPGTGSFGWCGDGGPATRAKLTRPRDVAVANDGSLIVADTQNQVIRRIDADGTIETIAGHGVRGGASRRVAAARATFRDPGGVAIDSDGSVLVADTGNHALRRIDASGQVTVVAGGLSNAADVVVLPDGGYAVSASGHDRVTRVSADGRLSPLAGTGRRGFSGDGGAALEARMNRPTALAVTTGGLLVVDSGNRVARLIGSDGIITTVAGRAPGAQAGPTPATALRLKTPRGVAGTPDGGFVVDDNALVWAVGPDGSVRAVAGTGEPGFNRDAGDALAIRVDHPAQLATGPDGAILIADTRNDRIRGVTSTGQTHTVAGSDRPDVKLAPVVQAPFRALPVPLPPSQRRQVYEPPLTGGDRAPPRARRRAPKCSRGTTTANYLIIQPYSRKLIRSVTSPVVIRFGTSVDTSVRSYAWRRDGNTFGETRKRAIAGSGKVKLHGTLEPGKYVAVIRGRSAGGIRSCDARKLRVVRRS
jgi:sugar lactone lactonase YvrE